jgi:hypothetical protein
VSARTGPRVTGRELEYEQLLADIGEGVRLHYEPRGKDPNLALLTGDMLYARGLSRLAELGDVEATAELADVISLIAQAQAAGDRQLASAIWEAGTAAVYSGVDPSYERAKELARTQAPGAAQALRDANGPPDIGAGGSVGGRGAAPSRTR